MKKGMLFEAIVVILIILLSFVLYLMIAGSPEKQVAPINGLSSDLFRFMYIGGNDTLYTVDGNDVVAISPQGSVLWKTPVDDQAFRQAYNINASVSSWTVGGVAMDHGILYLLLIPAWGEQYDSSYEFLGISQQGTNGQLWYTGQTHGADGMLVAFSKNGHILWSKVITQARKDGLEAIQGNVYVNNDSQETVLDQDGNVNWVVDDVYSLPIVDEDGYMYVMRGGLALESVDAYDPNGTLYWSLDPDKYNIQNFNLQTSNLYLQYRNQTLYVFSSDGTESILAAFNRNGSLQWSKLFDNGIHVYLYWGISPEDIYVYSTKNNGGWDDWNISIIHPDGTELPSPNEDGIKQYMIDRVPIDNGIAYYVVRDHENNRSLDDLNTMTLTLHNVTTGNMIWSREIPLETHTTVINESNAGDLMIYYDRDEAVSDNRMTPDMLYQQKGIAYGTKEILNRSFSYVEPGNGMIFVSIWAYNYEYPTFFGHSNCTYAFGVYAFDQSGNLVWQDSTGSRVTSIVASNGTAYYETGNGGLSAARIGTAAGFAALIGALYMTFRFFAIGAVARARKRIGANENRNSVLAYIRKSPGSTLSEIARATGMNLGTLRYHTLILGLNHRIVSYHTENKFVRYFPNSGAYSKEQQMVISLVRREGMGRMLGLLLETPGMTNADLSKALCVHESAVSRWAKELTEKGIILKVQVPDGRLAYAIKAEYEEIIKRVSGR